LDSFEIERRRARPQSDRDMKRLLNGEQLDTLRGIEQIGWSLRFVRMQEDGSMIAAVYNPDRGTIATIDPSGRLNEKPNMTFRAA